MGAFECCRICSERFVLCHSTCKPYLEAKAKHDEQREKERKSRECQGAITDIHNKMFLKMQKKRRKK